MHALSERKRTHDKRVGSLELCLQKQASRKGATLFDNSVGRVTHSVLVYQETDVPIQFFLLVMPSPFAHSAVPSRSSASGLGCNHLFTV
jgi:hypothetical protein